MWSREPRDEDKSSCTRKECATRGSLAAATVSGLVILAGPG